MKVKMLAIYFKSPQGINEFIFYSDEKLESIFRFSSICNIPDIAISKEEIFSAVLFTLVTVLDPNVHTTMQFDITKTFYRVIAQNENFFKPLQRWRCRIITASMDITYVDQ